MSVNPAISRPLPKDSLNRPASIIHSEEVDVKEINKITLSELNNILVSHLKDRNNFSSQDVSKQYNIQQELIGMHKI